MCDECVTICVQVPTVVDVYCKIDSFVTQEPQRHIIRSDFNILFILTSSAIIPIVAAGRIISGFLEIYLDPHNTNTRNVYPLHQRKRNIVSEIGEGRKCQFVILCV